MDQHLSSKNNTENIYKKITSGLSALCRIKEFVEKDTLAYNSLVWAYCTLLIALKYHMGCDETQSKCLQSSKTKLLESLNEYEQ